MIDLALTGAAFNGEPWRLWSGHLVHWGAGHLGLNLIAILPPLLLLRRRETARIAAWLFAAAPLVSFPILLSGVPVYRGASGLVVGFWCAAALALWSRRDPVPALVLFALVAAKLSLEGWGIAVVPHEGYYVVPLAHQAGAALGLIVGAAWVWCGRPARPRLRETKGGRDARTTPGKAVVTQRSMDTTTDQRPSPSPSASPVFS